MIFKGQVIDSATREGVPSATVELWMDNVLLTRIAADKDGNFNASSTAVPDLVRISSVGYIVTDYPFDQVVDDSYFPMDRNVKEEGGVYVTAHKTSPAVWIAGGLILLLLLSKKR